MDKQEEEPHNFEHYYEFFQFRDTITDGVDVFEVRAVVSYSALSPISNGIEV